MRYRPIKHRSRKERQLNWEYEQIRIQQRHDGRLALLRAWYWIKIGCGALVTTGLVYILAVILLQQS